MSADLREAADITILDFWAEWCGACRMIEPVVDRVAAGHPDVVLRKINVAEESGVAEAMAVRGLPTLVFAAPDGRELSRLSGAMTGTAIETALADARASLA